MQKYDNINYSSKKYIYDRIYRHIHICIQTSRQSTAQPSFQPLTWLSSMQPSKRSSRQPSMKASRLSLRSSLRSFGMRELCVSNGLRRGYHQKGHETEYPGLGLGLVIQTRLLQKYSLPTKLASLQRFLYPS